MIKYYVAALMALLVIVTGCSTDLNVLASYKESMMIYGLLNANDTAQYIKINKAFLGPGNALQMAQVYDSSAYGKQLTVQLQQISPNYGLVKTITLTEDSSIQKSQGVFSAPKQILWKTKAKLDSSCTYNLIVTNNSTHLQVSGSTGIVQGPQQLIQPSNTVLNFTAPDSVPINIEWITGNYSRIFSIIVRLYYYQLNTSTGVLDTTQYLDFVLPNQLSLTSQSGQDLNVTFTGKSYYQYIQRVLPVNCNLKRYLPPSSKSPIALLFGIGSQDLYTYIQISQPSTAINQTPPQFTDLNNGYGIFSSRYNVVYSGYRLGGSSIDSLYLGQFTKLLFCSPTSNYCPCN